MDRIANGGWISVRRRQPYYSPLHCAVLRDLSAVPSGEIEAFAGAENRWVGPSVSPIVDSNPALTKHPIDITSDNQGRLFVNADPEWKHYERFRISDGFVLAARPMVVRTSCYRRGRRSSTMN